MMWTISRLARKFDLSRSALLYYDSIGLLKPSLRGANGYRYYAKEDAHRLDQICTYRRAGLSLKQIGEVLRSSGSKLGQALEQRLVELSREITSLRGQQRFILGILGPGVDPAKLEVMNKQTWVALLRASGFSQDEMANWHAVFERQDPQKHQAFLEFLGVSKAEIEQIRQGSREYKEKKNH
jgi:DNA-binding transcriptional MerR regulator